MADVVKYEPSARMRITRNGVRLYEQYYDTAASTFSEYTSDRLVLATNMATMSQIDMGGVTTGSELLLVTDQPILVAINSSAAQWQVSKSVMLSGGSFTNIWVQNESTTNTAIVQLVVVD